MAKKMTIENLATLIQSEFTNIHGRIDDIDNKFTKEFRKVDKQLFDLSSDMTDVKQSIGNIEKNQVSMKEVVDYHSDKIVEIDNRVGLIEKAAV